MSVINYARGNVKNLGWGAKYFRQRWDCLDEGRREWWGFEPAMLNLNYVPLQSTGRKSINLTMPKSDHKAALLAIEKVLMLLRSVQTLEGTDKDGVEHLLEMAVENLKK